MLNGDRFLWSEQNHLVKLGVRDAGALSLFTLFRQRDESDPWRGELREQHDLLELPCGRGSHASWLADVRSAGKCAWSLELLENL